MENINKDLKTSLALINNPTAVTDTIFKNLLENCFAVLTGSSEPYNISNLYNSKPEIIKELYASLLSLTAQFVRTGQTRENVYQFLTEQCSFSLPKANLYGDYYEKNQENIEASLLNIGSHLAHITDVTWKIDYIVKSGNIDSSEGPLFRIGFQTEKFDVITGGKKTESINFTCTNQELQDLVYKLKDAVRHCQRIGNEH